MILSEKRLKNSENVWKISKYINLKKTFDTNTERSYISCSQILIIKLIFNLYYYYCNVMCFSDVGLQPGNEILLPGGENLFPFNISSYYPL